MYTLIIMFLITGSSNMTVKDIKGFSTSITCQTAGQTMQANVGAVNGYYCMKVQ